jgi:hypothetical protein
LSEQDQTLLYQQVVAKCWADAEFKAKLLADPKAVLSAEGLIVPEGKNVNFRLRQDIEYVFHLLHNNLEFSLEELDEVVSRFTYSSSIEPKSLKS